MTQANMDYWKLFALYTIHGTTVWKLRKFSLTEIFFREINSLVIYILKTLLSRNFCQKSVRVNFRNFHTVGTRAKWLYKELSFWILIIRHQNLKITFLLKATQYNLNLPKLEVEPIYWFVVFWENETKRKRGRCHFLASLPNLASLAIFFTMITFLANVFLQTC